MKIWPNYPSLPRHKLSFLHFASLDLCIILSTLYVYFPAISQVLLQLSIFKWIKITGKSPFYTYILFQSNIIFILDSDMLPLYLFMYTKTVLSPSLDPGILHKFSSIYIQFFSLGSTHTHLHIQSSIYLNIQSSILSLFGSRYTSIPSSNVCP